MFCMFHCGAFILFAFICFIWLLVLHILVPPNGQVILYHPLCHCVVLHYGLVAISYPLCFTMVWPRSLGCYIFGTQCGASGLVCYIFGAQCGASGLACYIFGAQCGARRPWVAWVPYELFYHICKLLSHL